MKTNPRTYGKAEQLKPLLEKIDWILSKPVIGYGDRSRLEAVAHRIRLVLEPERPDAVAADAITLINIIAQCEPLKEARV